MNNANLNKEAEAVMSNRQILGGRNYLNSGEIAALLGVSLRTVVNLRRRRVLPHIKIGRLVRFSQPQVEAALQGYTVNGIQISGK